MTKFRTLARRATQCAVVLGCLAFTTTQATAADVTKATPVLSAPERELVTLINNLRVSKGLAPLQVSVALEKASTWMAGDLAKVTTPADFDLIDSLGRDLFARQAAFGYPTPGVHGTIVRGGNDVQTATAIFNSMSSDPYYSPVLLEPSLSTMGVGFLFVDSSHFGWNWALDFGQTIDTSIPGMIVDEAPLAIPAARSAFVALPPQRMLDTRAEGPVAPDGSIVLHVLGANGVPLTNVSSVVLTVTITSAKNAGFVTVYPGGGGRPATSNLNVSGPGKTVANLVTVPVGPTGDIALYTSGGGNLLADVAGYYAITGATASAGRLQTVEPKRLLDTRGTETLPVKGTKKLHVTGAYGVPATGVSAVSVNLTVTGAKQAGFLTAYPFAGGVTQASNLNVNGAGETVAGSAIVPVDANGDIGIFVDAGGDLLVDINGWFTDATALASSAGLFVAQKPGRVIDSRNGAPRTPSALPLGAIAISSNITLTGTKAAGFLTAYPSGGNLPGVSSVNAAGPGATVANHAIVPKTTSVEFADNTGGDLIVDIDGYFLPEGV